jgi:4-oxalocrotonate tautomerase
VVWVLIEELHRDGWHIGGQPFFGPPTLMGALGRSWAAYEAIDGTPTTREDLATHAPVCHR